MSKISTRLRGFVSEPSVSDHYGAWGALRPDQRRQIRELCDVCDMYEQAADRAFGSVEKVKAEAIKKFAEKINTRIAKAVASTAEEMADIATKPKSKRSDALVLSNLGCRISTANMVSTLVDKLAKEEVGDNNG